METKDFKGHIQKLVDQIEDPQMLETLYDFLKNNQSGQGGELWQSLSETQKQAVLKAFEESENYDNLIPSERVFKDA